MTRLLCLATALVMLAMPAAAAPLEVVASFSVLGDLVRQVGGDHVRVTTLVGPDGDAHVFEPTPTDARAIQAAQLVVINGLGLEGWMTRLLQSTGYRGAVLVAAAGVTPHSGSGGIDPHAWQDVANVGIYVKAIVEGLAQADPGHAADYREAGAVYGRALEDLDREVRAAFARIPPGERKIITSHDAFGYYGAAYGLTLLAPAGVSTEAEPSAKAVGALITQIRKEHIKAVFIENMSDPRLIQRIARESGATIGGRLFSDALSPADGPAATYVAMIRHNTGLITRALAGEP